MALGACRRLKTTRRINSSLQCSTVVAFCSFFWHFYQRDLSQISQYGGTSTFSSQRNPTQAHEARGARGCRVTGDAGRIPLPAGPLVSGPLCRSPLWPCHMDAKQRGGEVECPVCRQDSVTFVAWMRGEGGAGASASE